jgi:peptide/nickel transport system permease protein
MLVIGVYVALVVANLGGFIDEMIKEGIGNAIIGMSLTMKDVPAAEKNRILEERLAEMELAAGLHVPFLLRCLRWLPDALLLRWGEPGPILEQLPNTLLLFGAASLLLFVTGLPLSLFLSRRYESWMDRLVVALSPISSAPSWAQGIVLVIIFSVELRILPFGGMFDAVPPEKKAGYALVVIKHMILPVLAILLSTFFQVVYAWRTFFLVNEGEDYVEMAKAKGLSSRMIERIYVLRPALPYLITSFALLVLGFWQSSIALEYFFNWPGVGKLYIDSIRARGYRPEPVVVIVVIFAYALAITIFVLDVVYAMVDPRVKIGGGARSKRASAGRRGWRHRFRKRSAAPVALAGGQDDQGAGFERTAWGRAPQQRERPPGPQSSRARAAPALTGIQALQQVMAGFAVVENAKADWLMKPGSDHGRVVDLYYPEAGMAIWFNDDGRWADEALARICRYASISLVTMEAEKPVTGNALREVQVALSATSRQVAQYPGGDHVKRELMPRIAAAKATCQRLLDKVEASSRPLPAVQPVQTASRQAQPAVRRKRLQRLKLTLREVTRYPSAVVGVAIIVALIGISIYTVIAIPREEVITLWRGDEGNWVGNPRNAPPVWVNLFRKDPLPENVRLHSGDAGALPPADSGKLAGTGYATKNTEVVSEDMTEIKISFFLDYQCSAFPQDLVVFYEAKYDEKLPLVELVWRRPDGQEMELGTFSLVEGDVFYVSQDRGLRRKLDQHHPEQMLFAEPGGASALKGTYELQLTGLVFEDGAELDAELLLIGQAYGLAGTDHRRRDLMVALLWGTPVALALGFLGAIFSSLLCTVIAAVGAWFGGWVDELVQRVAEVNVILPALPLCITIYFLYSKSIWLVLGLAIVLTAFGSAIKNYRAAFLQVRESPYIEAAQAYGASNWRIILRYLVPRIIPVLVPQLVFLIPGYVFLEATLSILGVSDPHLPTWGKVVYDALEHGAFGGFYYWVAEPIFLLMLTGLAFAMLGFALDRILNPRLRSI